MRQFQARHDEPGRANPVQNAWQDELPDITHPGYGRFEAQEAFYDARQPREYQDEELQYDANYDPFDVDGMAEIDGPEEPVFDGASSRGGASERGAKRGRPRGRGRGGWRQLLKGTEHEKVGKMPLTREERRERRLRGMGPRGKLSRHKRKTPDPGHVFKDYIARASKHFFEGQLDVAADFCRQAIGINPEIFQAHSLLSEILKKQGRDDDSVQALWFGAITIRNADVWILVAEKTLEFAGDNRSNEHLQTAIECYSEAVKLTKDKDIELQIRIAKFELYVELGNVKFSRNDCKNILRGWPYKTQFVREYALLTASTSDTSELKKALEFYDKAFEIYRDNDTFGDEEDETDPWDHLNIYLELIYNVGDPKEGLATAKRLSRWFIGRKDETFWDRYVDDDREWDMSNERRAYVGEFQQGRVSLDMSKYGQGLPVDIHVRMGLFWMKLGFQHKDPAMRHFKALLEYDEDVDEYHDMFLQAANALRYAGHLVEAAEFYDVIRTLSNHMKHNLEEKVWMQLATCYQALERPGPAIECFEIIVARNGHHYAKAGALLAKLYEDAEETDKARFLCNDIIRLGRRDLLSDAKIKMIPTNNRQAFAPTPAHWAPQRPMPPPVSKAPYVKKAPAWNKASNVLRELLPNGALPAPAVIPTETSADPFEGPTDIVPPKKVKKRVKKRDIVGMLTGVEGEEEEATDGTIKRPRLRKPAAPRPLSIQVARQLERDRLAQNAETRTLTNYAVLQTHWAAFKARASEEVIEQWVAAATNMLEDFASMKVFFPDRDRNVKMKISDDTGKGLVRDLHHSANKSAHSFLSVPFTEWNHIFVDLALLYAHNAEQDKCYRILQDVLWGANVFFTDPDIRRVNYATSLHCALLFNDSQYWIELARKIISNDSDFRSSEAFQLFACLNRFSFGSNWFSAGPSQKFMLRMVKQFDYLAMTPAIRQRMDWSIQKASLAAKVANQPTPDIPPSLDAGVLLIYGHMVAVANHSSSSLPYYHRALALQPDNIAVNLSIATMWIQNSMKRQTDNRHFGITQGVSAMSRYYDLRIKTGKAAHRQEAEYNVARMWHCLGLTHLAVPAYEKVLELSEAVRAEWQEEVDAEREKGGENKDGGNWGDCEDFALEAAFALQGCHALVGNFEAAARIGEEWLVL
jgi:general transcription factor 3C polypeptide 3 (transcription factor C subunit 4)